MTPKRPKIKLDSFNDLLDFGRKGVDAPTPSGVIEMDFEHMKPLPAHQFKLYGGQRLVDMTESIRQFGILCPIILWHTDRDEYIILSGHNRVNSGKLAGLSRGPVTIMKNLTQEDAILIASETNLRQRSFTDLSHSERAFCLAQHYNAMKSQGKRNDLLIEIETLLNSCNNRDSKTSSQVVHKLTSREKIGNKYGLSHAKVARYIRIASLTPSLLDMLDSGEIALLAAYNLSFIEDKEKQRQIEQLIKNKDYSLSIKKARLLREHYECHKLTETVLEQLMSGELPCKYRNDKSKAITLKSSFISRHFTENQTNKEIENTIDKALTLYFAQEK